MQPEYRHSELTKTIIGCAINVHSQLGPGLLESAYKECLAYDLLNAGLEIQKERALPLIYNDVKLECGYRADIIVESKIIIEIKSVEFLNDIHLAQVLTYLKLSNAEIGLLMNFNVLRMKEGIRRLINKYYIE